jgi:hypothetical protein
MGLQLLSAVSAETIRWALSKSAERVMCIEGETQSQIELRVVYGNLTIARRHCKDAEEARRWSGECRDAWVAYGWKHE